jgi:hypothetical protein
MSDLVSMVLRPPCFAEFSTVLIYFFGIPAFISSLADGGGAISQGRATLTNMRFLP